MSDTSVIPTPSTPDLSSVSVLIDGTEISGEFHVLSASVSNELNRIPWASLQLLDGEAAKQTFVASDADHFVPGREIEIRFGYRGTTESVFRGLIVKHRIRIRKSGSALLLDCRDRAVRLTSARRSRYFTDTNDADIIDDLISEHGLESDIAATTPKVKEAVQYDSTDWDFIVMRAEANGHVVAVRDGRIVTGPPSLDAEPVVTALFGATVLELDAEIDSRWQTPGRTATAWNAAEQAVVMAEATEPSKESGGNLSASDLSDVIGGEPHVLRHGGALSEPELQAWADARLQSDRLAKVRGRVRFQGFAGIRPGDVIELSGVGSRFAGRHYVVGVRHSLADGSWETEAAFGMSPESFAARNETTAPSAGGLVPSIRGLQLAVVTALEDDPDGEERIRIRLPLVSESEDGVWARLATLDAGDGRGTFFRPEIGDEVVVGFLDSDPRFGVVLGHCHSSAKPSPEPPTDDNNIKGYRSRSGMSLTFDDDKKVVIVETKAGNRLTLSEDAESVVLEDQNGNSVALEAAGITLESAKDVIVKASGDVKLEGTNVQVTAKSSLKAEGSAGVELKASGTLTIKGSLVQIN